VDDALRLAGEVRVLDGQRVDRVARALRGPGLRQQVAQRQRAHAHPAALEHLPAGEEAVGEARAVVVKAHGVNSL